MSHDPVRKVFVRQRVEYWVPTGTPDSANEGADWHELARVITWATAELKKAGRIPQAQAEAGHGQISVLPHDEHVIVRFHLEDEVQR